MIRNLIRTSPTTSYWNKGPGVTGNLAGVTGNLTDVYGDLSGVRGDLSGVTGNLTDVRGDLDTCGITPEDRRRGIAIADLIREGTP